jgi:hypothetical protein
MPISLAKARLAKAQVTKLVADNANVVGVGLTKMGPDYAVKVNLSARKKRPVPLTVQGVAVLCEVVGALRKQVTRKAAAR